MSLPLTEETTTFYRTPKLFLVQRFMGWETSKNCVRFMWQKISYNFGLDRKFVARLYLTQAKDSIHYPSSESIDAYTTYIDMGRTLVWPSTIHPDPFIHQPSRACTCAWGKERKPPPDTSIENKKTGRSTCPILLSEGTYTHLTVGLSCRSQWVWETIV